MRRGKEIELSSYIINFETLFEDYLREALRIRLKSDAVTLKVLDGNKEGKRRLFDDTAEPPAQPDIVIFGGSNAPLAVLDVKYKEKVDRADINQAVTYAVSYRTEKAILVHQALNAQVAGLRKIGSIGKLELFGFAIDLASDNLEHEEQKFAASVRSRG
jgi:5-methylcytosine-specific restriction enzyme subunit McrC